MLVCGKKKILINKTQKDKRSGLVLYYTAVFAFSSPRCPVHGQTWLYSNGKQREMHYHGSTNSVRDAALTSQPCLDAGPALNQSSQKRRSFMTIMKAPSLNSIRTAMGWDGMGR